MRTVMIVEDNLSLNRFYSKILTNEGLSVIQAKNCTEALQFLNQQSPDVLVLDMNLPDGSGTDVIKYVQQHDSCRAIELIALSGSENSLVEAQAMGVELTLHKPVASPSLRDTVFSALERNRV